MWTPPQALPSAHGQASVLPLFNPPAPNVRSSTSFAQVLLDQTPIQAPTVAPPPPSQPGRPEMPPAKTEAAPHAAAPESAAKRPASPAHERRDADSAAAASACASPEAAAQAAESETQSAANEAQDKTQTDDAADPLSTDPSLNEFTSLISLPQALAANALSNPSDGTDTLPAGHRSSKRGAAAPVRPAEAGAPAPADAAAGTTPGAGQRRLLAAQAPDSASTVTDTLSQGTAADLKLPADTGAQRSRAVDARSTAAVDAVSAAANASSSVAAASVAAQSVVSAAAVGMAPGQAIAGASPAASFNPAAAIAAAGAGAGRLGADSASPAASSGTSATLMASPHSAEFAPELAVRVSLLAVNGTQQAELHLNPADMGPVSVQIQVDGAQAQVSFHAAQADTRDAIERGLPDLAAALRDQGLTLSGGGVFQQSSRESRDDAPPTAAPSRLADIEVGLGVSTAPAARTVRATRGLLDTFA